MLDFSCLALSVNYRVTREEVSALALLRSGTHNDVFDAVQGLPGASREAAKRAGAAQDGKA